MLPSLLKPGMRTKAPPRCKTTMRPSCIVSASGTSGRT